MYGTKTSSCLASREAECVVWWPTSFVVGFLCPPKNVSLAWQRRVINSSLELNMRSYTSKSISSCHDRATSAQTGACRNRKAFIWLFLYVFDDPHTLAAGRRQESIFTPPVPQRGSLSGAVKDVQIRHERTNRLTDGRTDFAVLTQFHGRCLWRPAGVD